MNIHINKQSTIQTIKIFFLNIQDLSTTTQLREFYSEKHILKQLQCIVV